MRAPLTSALTLSSFLGPLLSKDVLSNFLHFFRAIFHISIFSKFYFQILECEAFQNILRPVKYPIFGNVSCFSYFSCFCWKIKEENLENSWSIRTALVHTWYSVTKYRPAFLLARFYSGVRHRNLCSQRL